MFLLSWVNVCRPGRDRHEAVAQRCHRQTVRKCPTAHLHHGGAGSSVRLMHHSIASHHTVYQHPCIIIRIIPPASNFYVLK